ncbi:MAG: PQQ-like beta-propeller repeat protein [Planctomycetota bacterium]|nr:PQQ-like beta-propeller repeat protein [Planctomycetota bacterium]
MRKLLLASCILFAGPAGAAPAADSPPTATERFWPQWRGPLGTGVAPRAEPPLEWSDTRNVRWKTKVPGHGHSTPIIWGDRVFLTTAVPTGDQLRPRYSGAPGAHDNLPITRRQRFVVLAVRRQDGKIVWQRSVREAVPHEGGHNTASLASGSPVTDGRHIFACFGSYGLYCLDVDGQLQWQKDLGRMQTKHGHGEGSSPVLYGDTLVVNWDHEGQSFVAAFDKSNGQQRWKVSRDEVTSWSTPIVVKDRGRPQVVVCGTNRVRSYDLASGKTVWQCGGLSHNIVASPVAADGMIYVGSSYEKRALLAIRFAGASGDITGSKRVVWNRFRGTPYVPSPLLYGDALYFLTHYQGILTRVTAKTGVDRPGAIRLGGIRNVYASPVGAAGRVYVSDRDGTTLVIDHGDVPRVLARNRLDDNFSASAALVDRELFLRGEKYLYCIAEE